MVNYPVCGMEKEDRSRLVAALVIGLDNPEQVFKPRMIADVEFGPGVSHDTGFGLHSIHRLGVHMRPDTRLDVAGASRGAAGALRSARQPCTGCRVRHGLEFSAPAPTRRG